MKKNPTQLQKSDQGKLDFKICFTLRNVHFIIEPTSIARIDETAQCHKQLFTQLDSGTFFGSPASSLLFDTQRQVQIFKQTNTLKDLCDKFKNQCTLQKFRAWTQYKENIKKA
ncbi:MAG: hypothetical protein AB7H48_04545 [Parachlamydiales bacterium]